MTFGYDKSKPVLHEVKLEVEPGEMIGLVGRSGVGKTTTPFIVLASLKRFKLMRSHWGRWGTKWSRLTSHLNETIHGIRIVKAFAQEEREEKRFALRNEDS